MLRDDSYFPSLYNIQQAMLDFCRSLRIEQHSGSVIPTLDERIPRKTRKK